MINNLYKTPPTPVILAGGPRLISKARKLHPHHQVHWGENGSSISRWSISTPTHWIHGIGIGKPGPRERENMGPTEKEEKEKYWSSNTCRLLRWGSFLSEGTYIWLIFVGLFLMYHTWMLWDKIFPFFHSVRVDFLGRCPYPSLFFLPFFPFPKNLANDGNRKWCSRFEFLFLLKKVGGFLL